MTRPGARVDVKKAKSESQAARTDRLLREFVRMSLDDGRPIGRLRRFGSTGMYGRQVQLQPFAGLLLPESYVRGVLGIDRDRLLREGRSRVAVSDDIVREHLLFEGWWDKAKEFVADIVKDNPITNAAEAVKAAGDGIKGVVATLTSIAMSGADAIGTVVAGAQNLMSKGLQAVKKDVGRLTGRIKSLAGKVTIGGLKDMFTSVATGLEKLVDKLVEKIKAAATGGGWKGMLATVACFLAVKAVRGKIGGFIDAAVKVLSGDPKVMVEGAMKIKEMVGAVAEAAGDDEEELKPGDIDKEIASAEASGGEAGDAKDQGEYVKALSILSGAIKGFAWGLVKKVIGAAGTAAVEQLAGPVGFVKKLAEVLGKVAGGIDWVCQGILEAAARASFKPAGAGAR